MECVFSFLGADEGSCGRRGFLHDFVIEIFYRQGRCILISGGFPPIPKWMSMFTIFTSSVRCHSKDGQCRFKDRGQHLSNMFVYIYSAGDNAVRA